MFEEREFFDDHFSRKRLACKKGGERKSGDFAIVQLRGGEEEEKKGKRDFLEVAAVRKSKWKKTWDFLELARHGIENSRPHTHTCTEKERERVKQSTLEACVLGLTGWHAMHTHTNQGFTHIGRKRKENSLSEGHLTG